MSAQPVFHLVDSDTGEIKPQAPSYREALEALQALGEDVANLERENTRLLRRIRQLERDREKERNGDPQRDQILALIERWKKATGHSRSNANAADRFDAAKARLKEGYTIEQLELAVDGVGAYRYVVNGNRVCEGKASQRHDRFGIPIGNGEAVERFANLGYEARKQGWDVETGWQREEKKQ